MQHIKCRCGIEWVNNHPDPLSRVDNPSILSVPCPIDMSYLNPPDEEPFSEEPGDLFLYWCSCHRPLLIVVYDEPRDTIISFHPDHNDPNHPTA